MKKQENIYEEPVREIIKIETRFPVGVIIEGDNFKFECEISLEMAGKIIGFIGEQRDRLARRK